MADNEKTIALQDSTAIVRKDAPAKVYNLDEMVPSMIVSELNKYVIGQDKAKRTIAVALRNRTRRKMLPDDIREEVYPKNIIMIGPTGVGKTEIARRIAKLSNAPFIKVEATKYTEVGYVGRDVESMVRDLMGSAVSMVKHELAAKNEEFVKTRVEERLLDILIPNLNKGASADAEFEDAKAAAREQLRQQLRNGSLEDKEVEIPNQMMAPKVGIELMGGSMDDIQNAMNSLGSIFQNAQNPRRRRKVTIKRAREIFTEEEMERSVDQDKAIDIAKQRTEQMGIIFIDEIDKIAGKNSSSSSPDVSREGVQRDILPIVEGSTVNTKYGPVKTDYMLFIAAGAFHVAKVSDLIPELQGRFPVHVQLKSLTREDFQRILTQPDNALTLQYKALLAVDKVMLTFEDSAIEAIANAAFTANETAEDIGARRLHAVFEQVLEDISFNAGDENMPPFELTINGEYVQQHLSGENKPTDLRKYIL